MLTFSHRVSGRELLNALVFFPAITNYDVSVEENTAAIRIYEPLQPGTTYRLVLNKYMRDARGKILENPTSVTILPGGNAAENRTIAGKVYNRDLTPATDALILAFLPGNQGIEPDDMTQTGPDGSFLFEQLVDAQYRIFAVDDRNHDMRFNPENESTAVSHRTSVAPGTSSLLFRFAEDPKAKTVSTLDAKETPEEEELRAGTLSGTCRADGKALTVEALRHNDKKSFFTAATRTTKGIFQYSFPSLPPGTYSISASIPSTPGNNKPPKPWNPGKLEPFRPSEPFGVYPDTVRIRPGWVTDAVDFAVGP